MGRKLNGGPTRELVDPTTGERFQFRDSHTLFWIRMEYWAIICAVMALVMMWVRFA